MLQTKETKRRIAPPKGFDQTSVNHLVTTLKSRSPQNEWEQYNPVFNGKEGDSEQFTILADARSGTLFCKKQFAGRMFSGILISLWHSHHPRKKYGYCC
jgi:hypothetical protein